MDDDDNGDDDNTTTTTIIIITINLSEEIESRGRLCKEYEETINHLTSRCPILAKNEYVIRHDKVCTHLHYTICKTLGIETKQETGTPTYLSLYVGMKI
jgi:hypothetical protein